MVMIQMRRLVLRLLEVNVVEERVISLGPDANIDWDPQHLAIARWWGDLWRRLKRAV
jgi:hypothetical protein